jgi:hypothetical protein
VQVVRDLLDDIATALEANRRDAEKDSVAERGAMLVDAIGADHVRVLPAIPGTRTHVFNPDRIVLVPAATPLLPRTMA